MVCFIISYYWNTYYYYGWLYIKIFEKFNLVTINKYFKQQNNENVNNFRNFLKGHQNKILGSLEARMKEFSENMEFERAIREREKIVSLKKLLQNQVIEYSKEIDEDVFVIDQIGEKSFICVLDIREGKIINKNHIYVSLENVQEDDLFHRIFTAYYEKRNIPKNIILDKKYEAGQTVPHSKKSQLLVDRKHAVRGVLKSF